jgi:hypothetical protein
MNLNPSACAAVGALLTYVPLDVATKRVLELGPGRGDALCVFRSVGATCSFIERHPGLYLLNRLRGFRGHLGNFLSGKLPDADITYIRGSITDAYFSDVEQATRWLRTLPGTAIVGPWWPGSMNLDPKTAQETLVGRAALAAGYEPVVIPMLNGTTIYPVTFVRAA